MLDVLKRCNRPAGAPWRHSIGRHASKIRALFLTPSQIPFHRMVTERDRDIPRDFADLHTGGEPGLVSIILPVYNGQQYLAEAIDSVLAQSYRDWELIIVDDGSTDNSLAIATDYAARDSRIRFIHQDNQQLPAALNVGHALACGEYLTWTSDDNRLKEDFLHTLVEEMERRPHVDMLYANLEVIDGQGAITGATPYYRDYQSPPGSGIVRLPEHVSMLHIWNCAGAAFLYRRRVIDLIGAYSARWFTCEDYDFFLRVNAQMCLRHSFAPHPLYQYRMHGNSLTAKARTLDIDRKTAALLLFDDARWDLLSGPMAWHIEAASHNACQDSAQHLRARVQAQSHYLIGPDDAADAWSIPVVYVYVDCAVPPSLPRESGACAHFLLHCGGPPPCEPSPSGWDLCLVMDARPESLPEPLERRGWIFLSSTATLWHTIRTRASANYLRHQEKQVSSFTPAQCELSAIVCTNREPHQVGRVLQSLAHQSLDSSRFEIILVNNALGTYDYAPMVAGVQRIQPAPLPLRTITCRPGGLSYARNAGLKAALGAIVLFLDDDIEAAPDLFERILDAYGEDPELGVLGGAVRLEPPCPRPWWYGDNLARFWSELIPREPTVYYANHWLEHPVGANWSARREALLKIGGFRSRYGRGSRCVAAGEEMVASAAIEQLSMRVGIAPGARVVHCVGADRFKLSILFRTCRQSYATIVLMMEEKRIPPLMHLHSCLMRMAGRFGFVLLPLRKTVSWRVEQLVLAFGLAGAVTRMLIRIRYQLTTRPVETREQSVLQRFQQLLRRQP